MTTETIQTQTGKQSTHEIPLYGQWPQPNPTAVPDVAERNDDVLTITSTDSTLPRLQINNQAKSIPNGEIDGAKTGFGVEKKWFHTQTIDEARHRFKDALQDAQEEEEATPSDKALENALRAVQMMDQYSSQNVSSIVVLDGGIEATVRGSNRNYISVECQQNGDVLVMFNVRSYARYERMDEAEREGFLKVLLETLRY